MRPGTLLLLVLLSAPRPVQAQGTPLGTEFRVNTYTTESPTYPRVASDASGNFVVVWEAAGLGGLPPLGVFGQRYDSSGVPLGSEFRVNTSGAGPWVRPAVASDATGNFIVVWASYGQDGSSFGIVGQRYGASGAALGSEFAVNSYTTGTQ